MTRNLHGVGRGWAVVASLVIGVALMALPSGAQDAPAAKPAAEKAVKKQTQDPRTSGCRPITAR